MRLTEQKIGYLAAKITELLQHDVHVNLLVDTKAVEPAVKEVILFDLRREDELEQQAQQLLAAHRDKLEQEDIDYRTMLNKTKAMLAKQKGIIL